MYLFTGLLNYWITQGFFLFCTKSKTSAIYLTFFVKFTLDCCLLNFDDLFLLYTLYDTQKRKRKNFIKILYL